VLQDAGQLVQHAVEMLDVFHHLVAEDEIEGLIGELNFEVGRQFKNARVQESLAGERRTSIRLPLVKEVGAVDVEALFQAYTDRFGGPAAIVKKFPTWTRAIGKIQQKSVVNVDHSLSDPKFLGLELYWNIGNWQSTHKGG